MAEKNVLTQRIKILGKLFDAGCNNEKKLQELKMEEILNIPGITVPEMKEITEIQRQVKNKTLYSYLGGENDGDTNS